MNIHIKVTLSDLSSDDLRALDRCGDVILADAVEAAGHAMLALEALAVERLLVFCRTGRFQD